MRVRVKSQSRESEERERGAVGFKNAPAFPLPPFPPIGTSSKHPQTGVFTCNFLSTTILCHCGRIRTDSGPDILNSS